MDQPPPVSEIVGVLAFLALSLFVLIWSLRELRARQMGGGVGVKRDGVRIVSRSRVMVVIGCIILGVGFLPSRGDVQWAYSVVGLAAGVAVGYVTGRAWVGRWSLELEKGGRLRGQRRRRWQFSTSSLLGALLLVAAVAAIASTLPGAPPVLVGPLSAAEDSLCGFFIASGALTGLWARKLEHRTGAPLMIPIDWV